MTSIVIWRNDEIAGNPALWAAADSLISAAGNPLIGDAVKIFPLPIICRRPENGFFSDVYSVQTLGYCFAGSTLMGQNAYLGLTPLLSNVISPASVVPSLSDIARQILTFLQRTFDDYKVVAGQNAVFEVAVFGHCLRNDRPEIYHFRPAMVDGIVEMVMIAHQDLNTHDFIYLGDHCAALTEEIAKAFADDGVPGRLKSRSPRYVIEDRIADVGSPTIGGDLQLAIADRFGFRPMATLKYRELGNTAAYMSYLGRELTDELTTVGGAQIALMGMA